jgi:acetoin utilization deacetylase AcuC-like enzyme
MRFLAARFRGGSVVSDEDWVNVESPERLSAIKIHLEKFATEFPIRAEVRDFGLEPILAVHEKEYVDYLRTIYPQWYVE